MDSSPCQIMLVDDHQILIDGLKLMLKDEEDLRVVAEKHSAEDALDFLVKSKVDLILSDYGLEGMNGLQFNEMLKKQYPDIKIIILSMHDEPHIVKEILKSGVDGYLLKNITKEELLTAIHKIMNGETYTSSEITKLLVQNLHQDDQPQLLTARERQIVQLIAKEYTNKRIAEELFISERTVENHRKNIFRKTKTNSLVGLIKFAYANNVI